MAFFDDCENIEMEHTPVSIKALSRLGFKDSGTIAPTFTYAIEDRNVKTSWGGPTYTTAIYFNNLTVFVFMPYHLLIIIITNYQNQCHKKGNT